MRNLSAIVCNQNPLVLPETAVVREACAQMSARRAGSVLVVDARGVLTGIFTGRDAVACLCAKGTNASETPLSAAMTRNPITMAPNQTALDALRLMWDGGFRHVPVVEGAKIVACVSRGDFKGEELGLLDDERELWEHMR